MVSSRSPSKNGTIWNRATIQSEAWIRGTIGNDTLNGTSDADTLDGGPGNDALNGAANSDTYIFGIGSQRYDQRRVRQLRDRHDQAGGLNPADVTLSRVGQISRSRSTCPVKRSLSSATSTARAMVSNRSRSRTAPSGIAPRSRASVDSRHQRQMTRSMAPSMRIRSTAARATTRSRGAGGDTYIFRVGSAPTRSVENSDSGATGHSSAHWPQSVRL